MEVVGKAQKTIQFETEDEFLKVVSMLLQLGEEVTVLVSKTAVSTVKRVNEVFKELGIEVKVEVDDNPDALDYLCNMVGYGIFGAATMSIGAACAAGVAKAVSTGKTLMPLAPLNPAAVKMVAAAAGLGGAVGAYAGFRRTKYVLRVRFYPLSAEKLEMNLRPMAA